MKLTIVEAVTILEKHLGISVEISDEDEVPEDWIINAKTSVGHPNTLDEDTLVEIVYKSMNGGEACETGHAGDWGAMWKVDGFSPCITKYRVLE